MQEAEVLLLGALQLVPVLTGGFQQRERAHHVGLHEGGRTVDGAVDVAFGREVHHGAGLVLGQQRVDGLAIADVDLLEVVRRIAFQRRQVLPVSGVGELVDVDHRLVTASQPVQHEVRADETGTTCHENHVFSILPIEAGPLSGNGTRPGGNARISPEQAHNFWSISGPGRRPRGIPPIPRKT